MSPMKRYFTALHPAARYGRAAWRRRLSDARGPRRVPGRAAPRPPRRPAAAPGPPGSSPAAARRAGSRHSERGRAARRPPRRAVPDLRGQFATALGAARGEDGPAGPGAHAQPEAVGLGAAPVVRLEGALAHWRLQTGTGLGTRTTGAGFLRAAFNTEVSTRPAYGTRDPATGSNPVRAACPPAVDNELNSGAGMATVVWSPRVGPWLVQGVRSGIHKLSTALVENLGMSCALSHRFTMSGSRA